MKTSIHFFTLLLSLSLGSFFLFSATQESILLEKKQEEERVQEDLREKKQHEELLQERLREKKRIERQREKRAQEQRKQYR